MHATTVQVSNSRGRNSQTLKHRQQGAALIVGLIMLLLLTLIGVAGMRDTLLQEKMAGNMLDREVALQAAESALRAAEASIAGKVADGLPLTDTSLSAVYGFTLPQVSAPPSYVIEMLGQTDGSGFVTGGGGTNLVVSEELSSDVQEAGSIKYDYRITATATGITPDSQVILQSTYRQDATPTPTAATP